MHIDFEDYSSLALDGDNLAIASQASSRVWLGKINLARSDSLNAQGKYDYHLDPKEVAILSGGGRVMGFPRDGECNVQYCNIEGIHFVEGSEGKLLVAVSDRMKGQGRQDHRCLDKDQSMHLFSLPA